MGLFDKVFEKKNCDICGGKIGLLGNRKLEDGNLCKDCAAKLSPWFSERRKSTVAQIRDQLSYREMNRSAVAAFHATRTLGKNYRLLIDDESRKFMVTSASDLAKANPDVLDFSQAAGCDLNIRENRSELKRKDQDGKQVSYNPPRYEYSYNFHVTIYVSHPWFDDIHYLLNSGAVKTGERQMNIGAGSSWTMSRNSFSLQDRGLREYEEYIRLGEEIRQAVEQMKNAGNTSAQSAPAQQAGYQQDLSAQQAGYQQDLSAQQAIGNGQPQAAAPVHMQKVTCPWCAATVDAGAECPLCGGPL